MPIWVVWAALASIAATAVLTWVLWRINLGQAREGDTGGSAAIADDDD